MWLTSVRLLKLNTVNTADVLWKPTIEVVFVQYSIAKITLIIEGSCLPATCYNMLHFDHPFSCGYQLNN